MKIKVQNKDNPNIQLHNYNVITKDGTKANVIATNVDDAKITFNSVLKESEDNSEWIGKINLLNSEGELIDTRTLKIKADTEDQADKYLNQYILVNQADGDDLWKFAEIESLSKMEEILWDLKWDCYLKKTVK